MNKILKGAFAVAACAAFVLPAMAATTWPTKPIEIVAPYKAGGDTDFHARTLAKYLEPILGQPVVITNMEGASGSKGMIHVKNARPDGYKALYFHESMLTNKVSGITNFAHEVLDLCAASVVDNSYVLAVDAATPYMNLKDLVADAKAKPGKIAFAASISGYSYYIARQFEKVANIKLNVCDAGNNGARNAALLSHKMQVTANVRGGLNSYIKAGKFRALAALRDDRNPLFPELPTAKEQGIDLVGGRAYFLSFPKGTDKEIVAKMEKAIKQVCANPEFIKETEKAYLVTPQFLSGKDLKARLDKNLAYIEANPKLLLGE